MIDFLLCGANLICQYNLLKQPKYPPDVAVICHYYEEQKVQLPEYCKWYQPPIRKRNEF